MYMGGASSCASRFWPGSIVPRNSSGPRRMICPLGLLGDLLERLFFKLRLHLLAAVLEDLAAQQDGARLVRVADANGVDGDPGRLRRLDAVEILLVVGRVVAVA